MKLIRIGKFEELELAENQHGMIIEGTEDEARNMGKFLYRELPINAINREEAKAIIEYACYTFDAKWNINTNETLDKLGFKELK